MYLVLPFLEQIRTELQELFFLSSVESISCMMHENSCKVFKIELRPFHAAAKYSSTAARSCMHDGAISSKIGIYWREIQVRRPCVLRNMISETDARKQKLAVPSAGDLSHTSGFVSQVAGKRRRGAALFLSAVVVQPCF